MSIFSKIKGAKKAANKHKEEKARQSPTMVRDAPAPYRHIPTHAAVDALSGAPSSWKEEDRSAIKAQHKRRSMMTRAESGMSTYHGNASYNNSSYNNSTYYGSDLRLVPAMPSKAEMRRSYASSSARHISPLVTKRGSPAASETNSTSSSTSQFIEIPYAGNKALEVNILDLPPKSINRKIGDVAILTHPHSVQAEQELRLLVPSLDMNKRAWGFDKGDDGPVAIIAH